MKKCDGCEEEFICALDYQKEGLYYVDLNDSFNPKSIY